MGLFHVNKYIAESMYGTTGHISILFAPQHYRPPHVLNFQKDFQRYRKRSMIMKRSLCCRIIWFCCRLSLPFALCIFHLCSTVILCRDLVPETKVPAIFSFGDSLTDTGNNNDLFTLLKSNFPPYGKDFERGKPTGRFSNGRILLDFLAEALGVKKNMAAHFDPELQEKDLLTGVSFASMGGGFDKLTSTISFAKSMKDQLKMCKGYINKVEGLVGFERTNFILNNSIFFVVAGTADLITYFDSPFRRIEYDVDSYTHLLLRSATSFIKKLYNLGARKIVVCNIPAAGCTPLQRTLGGGQGSECAEDYNQAAMLFNTKLAAKLEVLKPILPGSKLVYIDFYSILLSLIQNGASYGFKVVDKGCCGSGLIELAVLCNPLALLCENHTEYFFWDSLHPTERAYKIISNHIKEKYLKQFL